MLFSQKRLLRRSELWKIIEKDVSVKNNINMISSVKDPIAIITDNHPIVCADGLMMKCSITDNSYVPIEMINLEEFLNALKNVLEALPTPQGSPVLTRSLAGDGIQRTRNETFNEGSISPRLRKRANSWDTPTKDRKYPIRSPRGSPTPKSAKAVLLKLASKRQEEGCNEHTKDNPEPDINTMKKENVILKDRFQSQLKWFKDSGTDFIAMETLTDTDELAALLNAILECKSPTAIEIEINDVKTVTVSYQSVTNFKQEFMMLKLKSDYCLFLEPF